VCNDFYVFAPVDPEREDRVCVYARECVCEREIEYVCVSV